MSHQLSKQSTRSIQQHIDKKAVADSFSKAARHYDQFAQLQRDIGEQLFERVIAYDVAQQSMINNVVDLGCGTGYFSEKLAHHYTNSELTCFDLSSAMLEQVKKRNLNNSVFCQGDIDALPFNEHSQDVIYSNLVVQWSDNLSNCLTQVQKSLKKGGKAYLSTLLSGSLHELTQAWKYVDNHPHTNTFLDLADIHKIIESINFTAATIKTETRILYYQNVVEVMRALKGIGANHVHGQQKQKISGRQLINRLEQGYLPFKNENGLLTLTYQVCYIEVTK